MKFKDLMNKYKEGLASDEEMRVIEEELEKYEAIEEYLADNMDMDFDTPLMINEHKNETRKLKKSVNNRLRKIVFAFVGIMTAILISIFFIISPIVDSMYYNPTEVTLGENQHDINFDLKAIIELKYPGYALSSGVDVDGLGFGEYDISYFRMNFFKQETDSVNSKLKRNEYITNHTSWTNDSSFNFQTVRLPQWFTEEDHKDQKERVTDHISQLSPVAYTSSWLTFDRDLTMEEFWQLQLDYPDITFAWAGVRTASVGENIIDLLGFSTMETSGIMLMDTPSQEKYPAFDFLEWLVNPVGFDKDAAHIEPRGYELHFKDLLKYSIDRKAAINVLEQRPLRHEYYEDTLAYVEEHGVKTFGVMAFANAEDLIELLDNDIISTLELNQVTASKRYIY